MSPEEFLTKVDAAAILHNMGVIQRRTGKYEESVRSYEDCLDLYNECLAYYNSLSETAAKIGISSIDQAYENPNNDENNNSGSTCNSRTLSSSIHEPSSPISPQPKHHKNYSISSTSSATTAASTTASATTGTPPSPPVCLELKIAQTLQSIARLYLKSLNDKYSAIKAHEDAITLLVKGKFEFDDEEEAIQSYYRQMNSGSGSGSNGSVSSGDGAAIAGISGRNFMCYDSPQRQERISRHHNLYNEYHMQNSSIDPSPTSVLMNHDHNLYKTPSPLSRSRRKGKNRGLTFDFALPSEYNVVKLTQHERVRVITSSLCALAKIYTLEEVEQNERKKRENGQSHKEVANGGDEENRCDQADSFINDNEISEDPLRYYQEAVNFLCQVPNPASKTSIPALSNNYKAMSKANDASLTVINSQAPTLTIDLRKDLGITLMQMGALHMARGQLPLAVNTFQEALRIRSELYNNDETNDEVVESIHSLAIAYEKSKEFHNARIFYQKILKIKIQSCGPESMDVANLHCNLSNVLRQTNNLAESLSWNKRGVDIYRKNKQCCEENKKQGEVDDGGSGISSVNLKAREDNISKCIVGALKNQGALYMQMGVLDKAIQSYREVMDIQLEIGLGLTPDFATTLHVLGDLYFTAKDLKNAKASFLEALNLYRRFGIGENDPDLVLTTASIKEIEWEMMKNNSPRRTRGKQDKGSQGGVTPPQSRHSLSPESYSDGFTIDATSPEADRDDLVSNITFLTKKSNSYQGKPCAGSSWDATGYVHEGVMTMSKAIGTIAAAAEDFLAGVQSNKVVEDKKPVYILSSDFETETAGDVSTIFGTLNDNDDGAPEIMNQDEDDEDLSALLGTYTSKNSSKRSISSAEDGSVLGTAFLGSVSGSYQQSDSENMSTNSWRKSSIIYPPSIREDASTLFGTSFVNSVMTASKSKDDASTLFGTSFVQSTTNGSQLDTIKSPETMDIISTHQGGTKNCQNLVGRLALDCQNIDDLLAQMNVVTNDMGEEDTAKPFKEVVQVEASDFEDSPDYSLNRRKNFQKLSNCLDKLEELEENYGSGHVKCLDTLVELSKIYFDNGDKDKGINTLSKVVDVQIKKHGEHHVEVVKTYLKIGKLRHSQGEHEKAVDCYKKVKDIEAFLFGNTDPRVALTLNKLGLAELSRGDFDMAMDYLQEALRIQRIHLAPNEINPDVSQTLVNIGSVYYKERNSFNKIRDNLNKDDNYKSFIESGMLGKIAFAHSERGEFVLATHFYEELLQLLRNRGEARSQHGIVATLNHLGTLSIKLGRYVEARSYYDQALEIMHLLPDISELDICETNCNIGIVQYKTGKVDNRLMPFVVLRYLSQTQT